MNAIVIAPNLATEDELWVLSHDGYRFELWDGELKAMSPAGAEHGALIADVSAEVGHFVLLSNLGQCFGAGTGFRISENPATVLAPDFAFIRKERVSNPLPQKFVPVVPDLVLEVRSPGDTAREVADKIARWLDAGTCIVWELNPRTRKLTVFRPDVPSVELGENDTLDAQPLLPGWSLELKRIL